MLEVARWLLSDEVGVLHRHVEAFFDEGVVCVDVGAWSNDGLRARRVVNTRLAFGSETFFAGPKHHRVLQVLVPRLIHRLGALLHISSVLVQAWAGHLQLKALSVEDLVVIESGRCGVETDSFSGG